MVTLATPPTQGSVQRNMTDMSAATEAVTSHHSRSNSSLRETIMVSPPVVRSKLHGQVKKGEDFALVDESFTIAGISCGVYCVSGKETPHIVVY